MCRLHDGFSFSHAVVTGASEGIGRGYALEVHNHVLILLPLHEIRSLHKFLLINYFEIPASQTRSECGDNESLSR